MYLIDIGNTCSLPVNVTFKRESFETFSLIPNKPPLTTNYNDRIFTISNGMGKVMECVLSNGHFEIDETGIRDKDNPDTYVAKWKHEYKVYIETVCAPEVTVTFFREKLETFSSSEHPRIETDYNERVFKFKNSAGKVMEYVLSNGYFEVDEIGLRSKFEPNYYHVKWSNPDAGTGSKIVKEAKKYFGTPYVWGGIDPKKGIDCSALTQYVYGKAAHIKLPRVANDQWKKGPGKKVKVGDLQVGDLVFFQKPGYPAGYAGHVGIYAGDGKMVNSQCSGGVKVANIYRGFGKILGGRHIV